MISRGQNPTQISSINMPLQCFLEADDAQIGFAHHLSRMSNKHSN